MEVKQHRKCGWGCLAWKVVKSHDADGPTHIDEAVCLLGHPQVLVYGKRPFEQYGVPQEPCERPIRQYELAALLRRNA